MPTTIEEEKLTDPDMFPVAPDFANRKAALDRRRKLNAQMRDQAQKNIEAAKQGFMVGNYWIAPDTRGDVLASGLASGLDFLADREEKQQADELASVQAELLRRMPSETRTLAAIPAGNNPDEQGEQVPARQIINDQFDQQARQWALQAGNVPGMEPYSKAMFAESVKAPGRRMEKQEAREARQAELDANRAARQQEQEANRAWRSEEANRNRDDREAARQLSAADRAAFAAQARSQQRDRFQLGYDAEGNAVRVNMDTGETMPLSGVVKPPSQPTESERGAAGYLGRMQAAEQTIAGIKGGEPTELTATAGAIPGVGDYVRRAYAETEAQGKYRQAQEDWVRAKLRKESGAVIGKDEMRDEISTYFPRAGDSDAVKLQKAQARRQAEEQMRSSAGRAKPTIAPRTTQAPTVTRTGKDAQGRKVEMLSDGTVRYATK